jgi:hypothetical protein
MNNVGVAVDDLKAAIAFFAEIGLISRFSRPSAASPIGRLTSGVRALH